MVSARVSFEHHPPDQLVQALALDIAGRLQAAISQRGHAVLVVSGGKSPVALFEALRVMPLAWGQISISLADERCVPNDHPDSNTRLVRTHLLQDRATAARLLPLIADQLPLATPDKLARSATRGLLALGQTDVLVLGMGTDGHIASLFPNAANLPLAMDLMQAPACLAMELADLPANAPYPRLSQNLSMLLNARHTVLPILGADKLTVLQRAQLGPSLALPVSKLLHQDRSPVSVWLTR
jgi:6-phosphogluconolactonase